MSVIQASPDIQIEYLILADAVESIGGKLYMLGGGWTVLRSPNYPTIASMGIAIGVSGSIKAESEEYDVDVSIIAENDDLLLPGIRAKVRQKGSQQPAPVMQTSIFAANLSIPIPKPGRYRVRAVCGGASKEAAFDALVAPTSD